MRTPDRSAGEPLRRGELVRLLYRLGRAQATGVVTIHPERGRAEVLVLRRGHLITAEADIGARLAAARLARLASLDGAQWGFDGGTSAYPPGASGRQLALTRWVRAHLEGQLDAARADRMLVDLAGVRLAIRPDQIPEALDDTDRRLLAAMTQPRRLDQIWPMARTPRFRLLAFVHFLTAVGALTLVGIVAEESAPIRRPIEGERTGAMRVLGVAGEPSPENVKRAYRRMARALHPDLQPGISDERRRELEARLRDVNDAYQRLS